MKTKRLREAREAGLVLPQSGYEMSNEEMMYVDGGFWRTIARAVSTAVQVVSGVALIVGGVVATKKTVGAAAKPGWKMITAGAGVLVSIPATWA